MYAMSWASWALWGFVATLVYTSILSAIQGLGLTRMSIPYLLGTMFTPDRDRAKVFGFLFHLGNGMAFSLLYVAVFESLHAAGWWRGALIGLVQAAFVLTVVTTILPSVHPRMASEQQGPSTVRQLEPPGFLALHYGARTPIGVVLAHLVFGVILGVFYRP